MFESYSVDGLLEIVSERIQSARLNQNLTQSELAEKSGLSLRTISNIESGKANITLVSVISVLKVLGAVDQLESFLPPEEIRPVKLSEAHGKQRMRVRKPTKKDRKEWQWGDDK